MYTAAVLTPTSAQLLRWIVIGTLDLESHSFLFETSRRQKLPHHATINMGRFDEGLNHRELLGSKVAMKIDKIVYNEELGVCAAIVQSAETRDEDESTVTLSFSNPHPHITICLQEHGKPVFSNEMLDIPSPNNIKVGLDQTYELEAIIRECP